MALFNNRTTAKVDPKREAAITKIAKGTLELETLETRYRDFLDFHDLAVCRVKSALEEAYEAGREAGRAERQ